MLPELNDCFLHDKDRLAHAEAIDLLVKRTPFHGRTEEVRVNDAAGRIVSQAVTAPFDVPGHRNSAVDGFAFAHAHYDSAAGTSFDVAGRVAAGHPLTEPVSGSDCVRIFTGAPVPDVFDSVVMQEDVAREMGSGGDTADPSGHARITIPAGLKAGANVRAAGEDLAVGTEIVGAGQRLRPQDLAALTSVGMEAVICTSPARVGLFSSGDEVIRPGEALKHGQVYDANAAMLPTLVASTGARVHELGILPDDREIVRQKLLDAARDYDLVITSGGASLGEEDHIVSVLDEIGKRHLWQIAVKPGRPMMFGQVEDAVFMGLPGNPVAVFVCFLMYGRPLLTRLSGGVWSEPQRFKVPAGFEIAKKKIDRREFLRGWIEAGSDGPIVRKYPNDGSGLISSLRAAHGFIEIAEDVAGISEGELVDFIPFSSLGIA